NPAMSASFDATMAAGPEYIADAAEGYDWSGARHVVDVGGGTGALLTAVLEAHPHVRATLVDLPETVERGRRHLGARDLDRRCDFVGQSFFDPLPGGGDVDVLSGVIHDWGDAEATTILRRCAEATRGRWSGRHHRGPRNRRRRSGHVRGDGPADARPVRRARTQHRRLRRARGRGRAFGGQRQPDPAGTGEHRMHLFHDDGVRSPPWMSMPSSLPLPRAR